MFVSYMRVCLCVFVAVCLSVCAILGLSKWVRQLVQHHDTFSNAMQSLVAFSQGQQKVEAEVVPADSQTPSSTVSSPNGHLPLTVEGRGLPKASEPQIPCTWAKRPEAQQDTSPPIGFLSHTQLKAEQDDKAGELNLSAEKVVFLCCKVNILLKSCHL